MSVKVRAMTKAVKEVVDMANKSMTVGTLEQNNKLFYFIETMLLEKGMYLGYNLYCWAELPDGTKWLQLAGGDKNHRDENGHFKELPTDIRQFYTI